MKKIILTVAGVVLVAVAAQAQSPRVEVAITSAALNGKPGTTAQAKRQQGLQNAVTRRVAQAQQAAQAKRPQKAAAKPATKKPAQQAVPQAKEQGSVTQWLKAIFLGGRFPNESTKDYNNRMVAQSQAAAQPFK